MVREPSRELPSKLDRSGLTEVFAETFVRPAPDRWIDHYLPHWTTPDRSAARYDMGPDGLRLRIDVDQPAWRPEDGELRCSCFQSGVFAGPVGSAMGQHRYREGLVVRTPQATRHLFTPTAGIVEATMRLVPDPTTMLAVWLVGVEDDSPDDSGEICIAELFGDAITADGISLSTGIKAHHDPRLREEMSRLPLPIDATAWHVYAAEWDASGVRIYVDDTLVFRTDQVIGYPQAVTIGLFEFPSSAQRDLAAYPKTGYVREVRGWQR
ncbi:MAG TPA: glycoside hydrolase family 16 protein [Thermomicrobiales bacterium]|nr:glycoside hydrolase family 16 protein [Thermomicrobiales bacterium]